MDDYDRTERALEAALAEHRGDKLNKRQRSDLNWWRQQQAESTARELLSAIPKKLYCELSGRQVKVINEQARRYQLPIGEAKIDLFSAIAAFHDFLAENAKLLNSGSTSEIKTEIAQQELAIKQIDRKVKEIKLREMSDQWIERSKVHDGFIWLVARLRQLTERVGSIAGRDGQIALNELLAGIATEMESGCLEFDIDE